ncbi:MAG: SET domain-containing protein [Chlamydiia bacterium]|nr:SET domain-containing protein [Chlamydiia bacterium]
MPSDIEIKKSTVGQFKDGLGVFAKRRFKKGEIVIQWNLKILTSKEFDDLPEYERDHFCHHRKGKIYFYPDPERHVNRSINPNVIPDFDQEGNIAMRDIEIGEELSIPLSFEEDF